MRTGSNFPNHPCESSVSGHEKLITPQDRGGEELLVESSTEVNGIDLRASPQSNMNNSTSATLNSPNRMDQSSLSSKCAQGKQTSKNASCLREHRKPRKILDRRSTETSHIYQRAHLQNMINDSSSARRHSSSLADQSSQSLERSNEIQLPRFCIDYSQQDPRTQKILGRYTGVDYIGQEAPFQSVAKNTPFPVPSVSDVASQTYQLSNPSYEKRFPHIPYTQETIIERPVGNKFIDRRTCPQVDTENTSYVTHTPPSPVHHVRNSPNLTYPECSTEKQFPPGYLQQYPSMHETVIRRRPEDLPYLQGNKNVPYAVQNSSDLDHLSERSHQVQIPHGYVEHSQLDPRTHNEVLLGNSTGASCIDKGVRLHSIAKHPYEPSSVIQNASNFANQPRHFSERLDNKQFSSTLMGFVQKQRAQAPFVEKPTEGDDIARLQGVTKTIPSTVQNASNSINQSCRLSERNYVKQKPCSQEPFVGIQIGDNYINQRARLQGISKHTPVRQNSPKFLTNQTCQLSELSHEKRFSPVYKDYFFRDPHTQKLFAGTFIEVNDNTEEACNQSIANNVQSAMQNSLNVRNQHCQPIQSSHEERFQPAVDNYLYHHPRTQKILTETSTRSRIVQSSSPEIISEKKPPVTRIPPTVTNQSARSLEQSMEKQFLPVYLDFLNQMSYAKQKPVWRSDQNYNAQSNGGNSPSNIQNYPNIVNETSECSTKKRVLPSVIRDPLEQEPYAQEIPVESTRPVVYTENEPTASNLPNVNKSEDPRIMAERVLLHKFKHLLRKMDLVVSDTHEAFRDVRGMFNEYTETFRHVMKSINGCDSRNNNDVVSTSTDFNKIPKRKQIRKERGEILNYDEYDDDDDDDDEAPKRKRIRRHRFVLPPEYDPDDSKWTLKYRKAAPGLVELLPGSKVFINAVQLEKCKRSSKDCRTLGRMLMKELFSENALNVCSLTGARAPAFDIDGTNVRPGLDEHARIVLLTFIKEFAIEKGWCTFDSQYILNSMRRKIQDMRSK